MSTAVPMVRAGWGRRGFLVPPPTRPTTHSYTHPPPPPPPQPSGNPIATPPLPPLPCRPSPAAPSLPHLELHIGQPPLLGQLGAALHLVGGQGDACGGHV